MSATAPLLQTIEPDDNNFTETTTATGIIGSGNETKPNVIPTAGSRAPTSMASSHSEAEAGS